MHGFGVYTWADGRRYEGIANKMLNADLGEYYLDKKHGKGMYSWADGRKYDGMWQNGKQHGEGRYVLSDGTERLGVWKSGKRIKWLDENENEGQNDNEQDNTGLKNEGDDNNSA